MTAYDMRISDCGSGVCSSDRAEIPARHGARASAAKAGQQIIPLPLAIRIIICLDIAGVALKVPVVIGPSIPMKESDVGDGVSRRDFFHCAACAETAAGTVALPATAWAGAASAALRSEGRRLGKGSGRTWRYGWGRG